MKNTSGSPACSVLHNIGQIAAAIVVLGFGVLAYLPFLLMPGCLAGAFTGFCAQMVVHRIKIKAD